MTMANILLLETTTRVCSAGIAREGSVLAMREDASSNYSHSEMLTVFVEDVLKEAGLKTADLDAVAVSQGPGSYTGLRIGVSVAKGFCYARDIPLLAVDTMKALAVKGFQHLSKLHGLIPPSPLKTLLCPMIDARRMEVYYALYDMQMNTVRETTAEVIGEDSLRQKELEDARIFYFGDGAEKCREVPFHPNANYVADVTPGVQGMAALAEELYKKGELADLAYFEPFYLKNFVAGKPKVKGLFS